MSIQQINSRRDLKQEENKHEHKKTLEDISKVFQEVPPGFEPGIEVSQTPEKNLGTL